MFQGGKRPINEDLQYDLDRNEIYALVSFGRKQTQEDKYSGFYFPVYVGMVDAAMVIDPGITIEWHDPYIWDPVSEINLIQALTGRQVDGIVVTATGSETLNPAINEAIQAGIPVISFDSDAPGSDRLTFVGTNHFKAGYLAGKTMAGWLGGQGNVLVATVPQAKHLDARVQGFTTAIRELAPHVNLHVTYEMPSIHPGETLEQLSVRYREVLIRMLQTYPNIRGVFVTFARAGSAVSEAVESLQLHETIQSLVFDLDERVVKLVATERLRAVVGQDMYLMGYVSLILAHAARHAAVMPTKQDGGWRIPALQGFLDAHPNIPPDTEHKLRQIIIALEEHAHEPAYVIDTGVEVFGKERILDVLASEYETMRESLADKIDALGQEIIIRRQAEQALRTLNEELEQRVRERTASLEAANKELKDFAYVASHDLKAPLRGIARLAHWLAEDYGEHLDEEGHKMVTLLVNRVKRLDSLIDGILQYSRVGRTNIKEEPVDLQQLVHAVIESLELPEHIQITVDDELPIIHYNMTRMFQVFQNLISNAINFLDKPQGRITIGCQDRDSAWLFYVTDNGPGIEERYQGKIFEIFQTLAPRDHYESTGVGLALVKKIVELYGGSVWVESTVGEGSTFWFTLAKTTGCST